MPITELDYRTGDPQSAQFDERRRGTYTLRFIARTNTEMGAEAVLTDAQYDTWDSSLPIKGGTTRTVKVPNMFCKWEWFGTGLTASNSDEHSLCKDITLDQVATLADGGQKWSIVANFRPGDPNETDKDANTTPTSRPARVTFDRETFREEGQHGVPQPRGGDEETGEKPKQAGEDGKEVEIRNSAGGLYDAPVEVIKTRSVIVVTYNVADLKTASEAVSIYQGTINRTDYTIYTGAEESGKNNIIRVAKGTGLTREVVVSEQQTEGSESFYKVTFRIAIEPRRWIHRAVERGRQHIKPGTGSNEAGEPAESEVVYESEYVTLDANGQVVEVDKDGNLPATTTTDWVVYHQVNYNGLPFTQAPPTYSKTC